MKKKKKSNIENIKIRPNFCTISAMRHSPSFRAPGPQMPPHAPRRSFPRNQQSRRRPVPEISTASAPHSRNARRTSASAGINENGRASTGRHPYIMRGGRHANANHVVASPSIRIRKRRDPSGRVYQRQGSLSAEVTKPSSQGSQSIYLRE